MLLTSASDNGHPERRASLLDDVPYPRSDAGRPPLPTTLPDPRSRVVHHPPCPPRGRWNIRRATLRQTSLT
eukprot:6502771-Pyramimonas_sp.AAC.1